MVKRYKSMTKKELPEAINEKLKDLDAVAEEQITEMLESEKFKIGFKKWGKDFVADLTRAGVIMSGSAEGIGNMYKALGIKVKGGEEIMPIPFGIPVGDRPIVKGFSGMDFSFLFEGKEKKKDLISG